MIDEVIRAGGWGWRLAGKLTASSSGQTDGVIWLGKCLLVGVLLASCVGVRAGGWAKCGHRLTEKVKASFRGKSAGVIRASDGWRLCGWRSVCGRSVGGYSFGVGVRWVWVFVRWAWAGVRACGRGRAGVRAEVRASWQSAGIVRAVGGWQAGRQAVVRASLFGYCPYGSNWLQD
jgi:hypothetical protein